MLSALVGVILAQDCGLTVLGHGAEAGDVFGRDVCIVDDLTGDGRAEFAVGTAAAGDAVGRVSVHCGMTGAEIWAQMGPAPGALFGFNVVRFPDADNDGVVDLLVSAHERGEIYLLSGAAGDQLQMWQHEPAGSDAGYSLAVGDDIDRDGIHEVIVGAPFSIDWDRGEVLIVSLEQAEPLLVIESESSLTRFGWSVGRLPDVDSDGVFDLLVGDPFSIGDDGAVFAISSSDGDVIWTHRAPLGSEQHLGFSVGAYEDFDRDGLDDVLVGASASNWDGAAKIVSSRNGDVLWSMTRGYPTDFQFGRYVAALPDRDGDGLSDLAITTFNGIFGPPAVRIVSVGTREVLQMACGVSSFDGFGWAFAACPDGSVLIGAPNAANPDGDFAGAVYRLAPAIRGDVDCDGRVGLADLVSIFDAWGTSDCGADIDGDRVVDVADVLELLWHWSVSDGSDERHHSTIRDCPFIRTMPDGWPIAIRSPRSSSSSSMRSALDSAVDR